MRHHRHRGSPGLLALLGALALISALVPLGSASASGTHASATSSGKRVHLCHGHRPTIAKGPRRNVIIGTMHRDIIWAGRGRDVIVGRGGRDLICGGPGSDIIDGGHRLDPVYGGTGVDVCYAPTMAEHRLHHGCERHEVGTINGGGGNPPPPHHKAGAGAVAGPVAASAEARGGNFYANADMPSCDFGVVHLGNFYFTGEYTDPGWVAFRPLWAFVDGAGNVGDDNATDWIERNAPNDNQVYQVFMGDLNLSGTTVWGYEVYWWDGAEWTNHTTFTFDRYEWTGSGTTLPVCVT